MTLLSMVKLKVLIRHLLISQELFYWTQVKRKNFGVLLISMSYGYPSKPIIDCVVMLLTSSYMEQNIYSNTSKYGVWESTSPMGVLKEIILMVVPIEVISWGIQILQELLYTRNYNNHLLFTDPIMFGLMDIILASPYKTSTPQVTYSFDKILKVIFIIQTSSTWFHAKLLLHPLHLVTKKFSHMTLSYLPL